MEIRVDMNPFMLGRFAQLQRGQWLEPDEIRIIQRDKLRRLIRHAYEQVPYYRHLMEKSGINPSDIVEPEDLSRLPITRKSQIVDLDPGDTLAEGIDPAQCIDLTTSGSQGMPITVRFTLHDRSWWKLLALRGWLANGYRPWDMMLVLNDARFAPHGRRWFEHLGAFRQQYTSIYDDINIQLDTAERIRPHIIRGITSDVLRLGQALRKRGDTNFLPRLVLTSAELVDNSTRRSIETIFKTAPTDFYGSIECGWIAWECPEHAGYHINADCLVVEILDDGVAAAPGQPGEVVVTNLHSYAMPFIRYSVGDIGTLTNNQCACGRGLPLMRTVEGRIADCILLSDKRRISPYQITCTIEQIPGIARYQVYQPGLNELIVRVVPNERRSPDMTDRLISTLGTLLDHRLKIEVKIVDDIPKGAGGKFHVVLSDPARATM